MKILKKITIILCVFALILSLFGCGEKIRKLENYAVGEYGGHWSILYTDEDGTEEIAPIGSYQQPLVIQKGRIYFVRSGALVSVDPEGENSVETPLPGMSEGGFIFSVDEEALYCIGAAEDSRCWRVAIADQSQWAEVPIPRRLRTVDYDALTTEILAAVKAKDDLIRVRSGRVELDGNGSLVSMELEVLAYDRIANNMRTWNSGTVTVRQTLHGLRVSYTDHYIPVSVSQATVKPFMTVKTLLKHIGTIDSGELPAKHATGAAEGFVLTYKTADYEAYAKDNAAPALDLTGAETEAKLSKQHLVLAQIGGCDTALTDSTGVSVGNLTVVQMG